MNAGNQAQVLRKSSKGFWLPSHHLSISAPISLLEHNTFHTFLFLDSLKNRQRYRRMIGWEAVADGGMLRETQPGHWSLVLFVQRQCSEDATPHFGVLAYWLFWTEDIWGTPDTEIVSPKCLFSTRRDLPPKCTQLLWNSLSQPSHLSGKINLSSRHKTRGWYHDNYLFFYYSNFLLFWVTILPPIPSPYSLITHDCNLQKDYFFL